MFPESIKLKVQGKVHLIEKYKGCLKGKMYLVMPPTRFYEVLFSLLFMFLKDKGFSDTVAVLTRFLKNNFCRLLFI